MRFGSSNVVYRRMFKNQPIDTSDYEACTYKGIALKTIFFLVMTLIGAGGGIAIGVVNPALYIQILVGSGLFTFIFAMIALFSPRASKVAGSLYCISEGVLVGFLSLICAAFANGAVTIALLSTVAVFTVVTLLYVSNAVKVTSKFIKFMSMFAISFILTMVILYIVSAIAKIEISIGFSLLISGITVFLACLYLFFDLENIRQVVEGGYPKEYEWYASFGLAFTLIWVYVEILQIVIRLYSLVDRR